MTSDELTEKIQSDHLFSMFEEDLKRGMKQMTVQELIAWRDHVINNPYRLKGVSDRIIEMLDLEISHY